MDAVFRGGLHENSLLFKRSLDRIVDKYSKLQHRDGGLEIDFANTQPRTLARYMKLSSQELSHLESKSLTDLSNTRAEDITGNSQLEFTLQDDGADDSSASSSSQYSKDDDGMAQSNMTELTVGSLDESEGNFSEMELQPEDQDEELEMSLRRQGSSFVELYPSMISRIETARQRQNLSNAADSVLRRYHRWRQQSREGSHNNTLRHSNPGKMTSGMQHRETSYSPERRQFMTIQSAPRSPLQFSTSRLAWQADQPSPGRERGPPRREQHHSVCAMDLSRHFKTSKPKEVSLNTTYSMSEQLGEKPCTYAGSPSRPRYPTANSSLDLSLRSKRHSLSARSEQAPGCSTYASEVSFAERSDIYSSPVRQSPLKPRMINSLSRSPYAFSRSPRDNSEESFSREPMRRRLMSPSLSSPPQKPIVPQRMPYPQDSRPSLQPQLHSPQSATAGRPRLRRHHSFDSSLPSIGVSYSKKEIDEEFLRLYHKFVCLNKSSFFNSHPCRICARCPEASRANSSSALAALALSPHRSILRKRNRELGWGDHPLSKRSREECYTSSPGSQRHGNEMLRRRLSGSEVCRDDLFYSSSKPSMRNKFSTQQPTADAHQEAGMRQRRPVSAAEFSGLCSPESSMANGSSPRKWRTRITPAL
ncbi:uncharacterized protein si:dkeyp-117h8.4 isoform X2 [Hippoglossus hippoglossus]|uniref:uncharacterized protein si:dkeyp-117h8.4 isoform X2 n=1 Tax=Hippoglossus hippoglossus TaxID=8267 RepID=UPI00148CF9E9|nr:uncharacterized protein si:dkeyp-117h8.4 isoform X2 [Hippoglossus hippoglossus]